MVQLQRRSRLADHRGGPPVIFSPTKTNANLVGRQTGSWKLNGALRSELARGAGINPLAA